MDPILDQLFINDTIDRLRFPIFEELQRRRVVQNDRDITFHFNTYFDFDKEIWMSGFFKIQDTDWAITDDESGGDYKFPVLGTALTRHV